MQTIQAILAILNLAYKIVKTLEAMGKSPQKIIEEVENAIKKIDNAKTDQEKFDAANAINDIMRKL